MHFIDSIHKDYPLSKQLQELTGDQFSTRAFYSAHDPSQVTPAGVIVHKETGKEFFVPFQADPEQIGKHPALMELQRIALQHNGRGGFQHGDDHSARVNFAGAQLDLLEELGFVERTGETVKGDMLASGPEVTVTELGHRVVEAYCLHKSRFLNTRRLLEEGKIPKSILQAAEFTNEAMGKGHETLKISDLIENADYAFKKIQETTPGLETLSLSRGAASLRSNLMSFAAKWKDVISPHQDNDPEKELKISPLWNKEVGTQVKAIFFKSTGKYYAEGIVNMVGAQSHDRESVLKAFRENQKILSSDFYKGGYNVVVQDTPANDADALYKEFFTRMTPASEFNPNVKLNQQKDLDILSP